MDSLLLKALHCQKTDRPPVWLMRQAGRYMKEYRDLKEKYTFLELCQSPELASKVTMMPIEQFTPDAAILFADILLILQTLGFSLRFGQDQGPLIDTKGLLNHLLEIEPNPVRESLGYISETIQNLKGQLSIPLLGFSGAPFTLATYVLEGRTSRHFDKTKQWLYHKPELFHHLLDLLTDQTIDYLKMQIEAGVDAIQIFDSWAGHFSYSQIQTFSLPYLKKIINALRPTKIPIILFAKGSCALLEDFASLKPHALSLDATGNLIELSKRAPSSLALQGNLDPDLLTAPLSQIEKEVRKLSMGMQGRPGFIMNLGHGIRPNASPEAVKCFIDSVKSISYS